MKSLLWLLVSGALWLGLVQAAPLLDVPSQIVSLARSGYIAIFSIYLMVELRGGTYSSDHRPSHSYLYLTPLASLLLLALFSSDFILTPTLLAVIGAFYLSAFIVVNVRSERGQIRNASWDLLLPPAFLILILHPALTGVAAAFCLLYLVRLFCRPAEKTGRAKLDAFIVQLPSICIAPVVLIALRDVFDGGGMIDRTHVESFGLIINGVGAAVWTAVVMRSIPRLHEAALLLWVIGFSAAAIVAPLPTGVASSAGAILIAECFRGAIWLGTTAMLARLSRGKGFAANLIATLLPLAALWLGKEYLAPSVTLMIYAGFVLPVPVAAYLIGRRPDRSADDLTDHVDGPQSPVAIPKQQA